MCLNLHLMPYLFGKVQNNWPDLSNAVCKPYFDFPGVSGSFTVLHMCSQYFVSVCGVKPSCVYSIMTILS